MKRPSRPRVPGIEQWRGYRNDIDARHAHRRFFGKSIPEVMEYFTGGRSIQVTQELRHMPRSAFQYYVLAFADYLASDMAVNDCDAASCFLGLLVDREKLDPGSVADMFGKLEPTVRLVAAGQTRFDADVDIYGSFPERAAEVLARFSQA